MESLEIRPDPGRAASVLAQSRQRARSHGIAPFGDRVCSSERSASFLCTLPVDKHESVHGDEIARHTTPADLFFRTIVEPLGRRNWKARGHQSPAENYSEAVAPST